MSHYTYEVTKVIAVTVEADNETEAINSIKECLDDGEYSDSFYRADPQFKLLDVEE